MRACTLIPTIAILGAGCFTLHSVTRHGEPIPPQEATAELHSCYGEVASGADFEHRWEALHDDLAREWVGCLKARGIRMQGGDHPITMGPGATHEEMERDHDACLVPAPCKGLSAKNTPGVHSTDTSRPTYGEAGYRPEMTWVAPSWMRIASVARATSLPAL